MALRLEEIVPRAITENGDVSLFHGEGRWLLWSKLIATSPKHSKTTESI